MSRLVIGSRAELIAALRKQEEPLAAAEQNARSRADYDAAVLRKAFNAKVAKMQRKLDASIAALAETARAEALQRQRAPIAERRRAVAEELFLDALFIVAQFPGGQVAEAKKCAYAFDVRECAGLCRATWAEEAFWSGLVRVRHGRYKRTRLMYAAREGDAARVAWLLARGAPREVATARTGYSWVRGRYTALHFASSARGGAAAVSVLLAAGAGIDAAADGGRTPLIVAAEGGCTDAVRVLLAAGANLNAADASGDKPFDLAARNGHADVLRALLAAGASVDALSRLEWSPLGAAAANGRIDAVRALLSAGANVSLETRHGTPLTLAAQHGAHKVIPVLLEAGANVNAALASGVTPLHMAASYTPKHFAAIALLDAGAAINARDNLGRRPLDMAERPGMRALLEARGGIRG
jgi:hypothetical protein